MLEYTDKTDFMAVKNGQICLNGKYCAILRPLCGLHDTLMSPHPQETSPLPIFHALFPQMRHIFEHINKKDEISLMLMNHRSCRHHLVLHPLQN